MRFLSLWGPAAFLVGTVVQAQTPAQLADSYITSVNNLVAKMAAIKNTDTAQREAAFLPALVDKVNAALPGMRSLYGNTAAQPVLQARSADLAAAHNNLNLHQTRLLTGGCPAEGTIKSISSNTPLSTTFKNLSNLPLQAFWLDYSGVRKPIGIMQPGDGMLQNTYATHPFLFTDTSGRCVRIIQMSAAGNYDVSHLLAPTVGLHLAKLQK